MDSISEVLTWQFWVAAICVSALMTAVKKTIKATAPQLRCGSWYKAAMTWQNLVWGAIVALPPGFLKGDTIGQRMIVGVAAGTVSHVVYHGLLKRLGVGMQRSGKRGAVPSEEITSPDRLPTKP